MLDVVVLHLVFELLERRSDRRGVLVEVDEDEPHPDLDLELGQTDRGAIQVALIHLGRVAQPALEVVRPGVQGAAEQAALDAARALGQEHPAVLAHRGHHADLAVGTPYREERVVVDRDREVVAGIRQQPGSPDAQPRPVVDRRLLELEPLLGRVQVRRQVARVRDFGGRSLERPQHVGVHQVSEPFGSGQHRLPQWTVCRTITLVTRDRQRRGGSASRASG